MNIIETHDLSRRYGRSEALHGLDLNVPSGSVFAFIGPNGAGKTTTIKVLMNLLEPSSGEARVLGVNSKKLSPRDTGWIMSFGQKDGWFSSSWDSQLNLVTIECNECSFSLPKDATDLNDFTVVAINFRAEANLSSEWTLDADPFPFGGIVSAQK